MALSLLSLQGLCYRPDPHGPLHLLDSEKGDLILEDCLTVYQNKKVTVWMGHFPGPNADKTRWGQGSCKLQPTGHCLALHHQFPDSLWSAWGNGILCVCTRETLKLDSKFFQFKYLEGHLCRVIIVPEAFLGRDLSDLPDTSQLEQAFQTLGEIARLIKPE